MKKNFVKLMFLLGIIFTMSASASAQIYVKIRPHFQTVVRTPPPSRNHVWIDEDWRSSGRNYRNNGGRWANPPHRGDTWNSGRWQHSNRGDIWIKGSWRRHR